MQKTYRKETLRRYWEAMKQRPVHVLLSFLGVIVGSSFMNLSPIYYGRFFEGIAAQANIQELLSILWVVLGLYAISWIGWRVAMISQARVSVTAMHHLGDSAYKYIQQHAFGFFQDNFIGSLVKKINRYVFSFNRMHDILLWEITRIIVNVGIIIPVFISRSPLIASITIGWIVVYTAWSVWFTKYKLKYDIEKSALDSKTTGTLADLITNYMNVKLFAAYKREQKELSKALGNQMAMQRKVWDISTLFEAVQTLLLISLEVGMLVVALHLWERGVLTIGDFVIFQLYFFTIMHTFWGIGSIIRRIYESLADATEMTEILEMPHAIQDKPKAQKLRVQQGEITFQNVSFSYRKTRQILDGLQLTIKPGEKVALVGPSGAGKSTIIKLLLRQHDVTGGSVLIDGQAIADVTQESLWQQVSLVPQDPVLFHRSLKENIRYGKPRATNEQIIEAAKKAHAHEFISHFPEQYQTYVGERGVKLSGGERQRVAIARAMLKNAPILVLDEATSSLDSKSEAYIQDALNHLMKDKTVIVVAHRLSTVKQMDRILYIENGRVVEQGTHDELLIKKGKYASLWNIQIGKETVTIA